eukprot:COSAG02_NODE_29069_length_576_cov_1.400419_2_plen_94_part_01
MCFDRGLVLRTGVSNLLPTTDCSVLVEDSPPAGCSENPCPAGQQCIFNELSLSCTACVGPTVSPMGIHCDLCPAGRGPNEDKSNCIDCDAPNIS